MATHMKGSDRWMLPLSAILLVMGGLLGVQVHTQSLRTDPFGGRRTSALGEMLRSTEVQSNAKTKEIDSLRVKLAKYENAAGSDTDVSKLLAKTLAESKLQLGLVPVKGPGIVVELADSTAPIPKEMQGSDITPWVVHDYDLIQMTNELWADGAEAISINGQRIVTGSAINCAGRLIQVNHVPVAPPFIFRAIGNRQNLVAGLNMPGAIVQNLRANQLQVKVTSQEMVEVPAVEVAPRIQFAKPSLKEVAKEPTQ
jgi:uncharacterized protein YlxW (UPF0749 family)